MTFDLIIIGTGLAGYTLVKQFRLLNKTATIAMISSDDGRYYSKPMLSTGFAKNKSADDLAMKTTAQMSEELNVEIFSNIAVKNIEREIKSLQLADDRKLSYQLGLVFATGAAPIKIPLPTALDGRTFAINDLHHYQQFRQQLFDEEHPLHTEQQPAHVAVIGSGLVGCEYANDLIQAGIKVTVISLDQTPLQLLIPPQLGQAVQQQLADKGVNWQLSTAIGSANTQANGQLQLKLHNQQLVHCDIVLSAVGLTPRDLLAKKVGLDIQRGIIVDQYLATNDPHIFALGDCARINGINLMYVAILTLAAKALAKTLNGEKTALTMPASPVIVKTPCCPVVANPPAPNSEGSWQIEGEQHDLKACFYDDQQNLLGFGLTGKKVIERMKLAKLLPPIL